ncbi:MAG TPA: amino acid ABC transporter ATP-binding protein [Methylomirabilota bacterium]|nr:amino acid ABC transporter ATP-binding protein [Methylomirabilota bacterium]
MALLRVEALHKAFGKQQVLKGVSLSINKGETKVIIGPSGGGKSTLLRCINLLIVPDSGRVFLDNEEVTGRHVNISRVRSQIGFVFQHYNLFMHLTAFDNVKLGLVKVRKLNEKEAEDRALKALKDVGITDDLIKRYPAQLSGGQQQRVAIARATAMEPKIILLDEPTSALDPELIDEVLKVMEDLAKSGATMLAVTHEIGFAKKVANEIIFLADGIVTETGSPEEFLASPKQERTRKFLASLNDLKSESGGSAEK